MKRNYIIISVIISLILVVGIYFFINNKITQLEQKPSATSNNSNVIKSLILDMGNDNISIEKKHEISEKLKNYGKEAIPYLIDALDDERVFDPCYIGPSASVMQECYELAVKAQSSIIIRSIITPDRQPKVVSTDKGYRFYYKVDNWQEWWQDSQNKSLREIQRMVRDYYREKEEENNYQATGYRGKEFDYLDN